MSHLRVQLLALVCFGFVFLLICKNLKNHFQSLYIYYPQSTCFFVFLLFVFWRRIQNCFGLTPLHADFLHSTDRESYVAWSPFADRIGSNNCQTFGSRLNDENSLLLKWAQRDLRFCLFHTHPCTHSHTVCFLHLFFPFLWQWKTNNATHLHLVFTYITEEKEL